MNRRVRRRDWFGAEYTEDEEIPSLFPWVRDYEEDEDDF